MNDLAAYVQLHTMALHDLSFCCQMTCFDVIRLLTTVDHVCLQARFAIQVNLSVKL